MKLSFGAGIAIRDFIFDDIAPWPTGPDGGGSSLALIDPRAVPDHGNPFSWRPGPATPGESDTTIFPGGSLLDYATRGVAKIQLLPDGKLGFSIEFNQLAEDLLARIEISSDLVNWQTATAEVTASQTTGGGFAATTFGVMAPNPTHSFVRLAIELR